jgi:hypothetical protein
MLGILPNIVEKLAVDHAMCLTLTNRQVIQDLVDLVSREVVPQALRAHDQELVVDARGDGTNVWFRYDTDLVRNQVADGPRYLETRVHPCSEEDPVKSILGLSDFATTVVDPEHFFLFVGSVDKVCGMHVLALLFAITPYLHSTIPYPANINSVWRLNNKRGC